MFRKRSYTELSRRTPDLGIGRRAVNAPLPIASGGKNQLMATVCFSRRRCTEDGIRIASRYFATVRRAISMPAARRF
jgi:hypothetical protein